MRNTHWDVGRLLAKLASTLWPLLLIAGLSNSPASAQGNDAASKPAPAAAASAVAGPAAAQAASGSTPRTPAATPDVAAQAGLFITLDPPSAPIGAQDNSAVFVLRMRNATDKAMKLRIELTPLAEKKGEAWARATLPDYSDRSWAIVALAAAQELPVSIQIRDVTRVGQFEGQVRVTGEPASLVQWAKAIQVMRQGPGFAPVFKGEDLTGDVLTMKSLSAHHKTFYFQVTNPVGEAQVSVVVAAPLAGPAKSPTLTVEPASFKLTPGSEKTVMLSLSEAPERGPMRGQITLTDSRTDVVKGLSLRYEPMFPPKWSRGKLIGLVVVGALLSVLVGTVIPILVRRNQLWKRLRELSVQVDLLARSESRACAALQQRAYGVEALSKDAVFLSPRAEGVLAEATKRADDLQLRLGIVQAVSDARTDAIAISPVPASLLVGLARDLDKVADEAVNRDPAVAKTRLDATLAALAAAMSAAAILASIQSRTSLLPHAQYGKGDPGMQARLIKLHADLTNISPALMLDALVSIDREVWCADQYFNHYFKGVTGENGDTNGALLTGLLSAGNHGLLSAAALVDSLKRGVTPAMVDEALADLPKNATIQVRPSMLRVGDLAHCDLVFNNPNLANSPLMTTAPVTWKFGDGTNDAHGLRVTHVFRRDWWAALLNFRPTVQRSLRNGTVVPVMAQSQHGSQIEENVRVLELSGWTEVVNNSEVFSFFVALGSACLLALVTKEAAALRFDVMADYLNPIIWGFGADQMKSLVNKRPVNS